MKKIIYIIISKINNQAVRIKINVDIVSFINMRVTVCSQNTWLSSIFSVNNLFLMWSNWRNVSIYGASFVHKFSLYYQHRYIINNLPYHTSRVNIITGTTETLWVYWVLASCNKLLSWEYAIIYQPVCNIQLTSFTTACYIWYEL